MTRYETLQIILTAFLLSAAIIAACIYGCQLSEMQKATAASTKAANAAEDSVTLARQNAQLEQRAWITTAGITGTPELNKVLRIKIEVANTGKTFAKNLKITPSADPQERGKVPDFAAVVKQSAQAGTATKYGVESNVLFPPNGKTSVTLTASSGELGQAEIDALRSGEQRIFVYGKMTYDDIFKQHHWTTFCSVLIATDDGGWDYMTYETYNDIDDENAVKIP
jgi:hypothetical protein